MELNILVSVNFDQFSVFCAHDLKDLAPDKW
jgi:hypothetical protein